MTRTLALIVLLSPLAHAGSLGDSVKGTVLDQPPAVAGYGVNLSTPVIFTGDGMFWDDIRTPLLSAAGGTIRPAVLKSFRKNAAGTSDGTYLNAFENQSVLANEQELFFTIQMPHGWDGSPIEPHLHYSVQTASVPTTSDTIIFGLEYSCGSINQGFSFTNTIHSTTTVVSPYVSGYLDFSPIALPSGLSAQCGMRLFRNSSSSVDNYNADVFAIEMDFHYRSNQLGSRQETSK